MLNEIYLVLNRKKSNGSAQCTGPVGYILFARDPKTLYFLPGKNPNRFREKTMSRLLLIGHGIISTCKTAVFGFGLGIITWYKSRCFFSTCKFVTHYVSIFYLRFWPFMRFIFLFFFCSAVLDESGINEKYGLFDKYKSLTDKIRGKSS